MKLWICGISLLVLVGCGGSSALPLVHQIEHMVLMETLGVDLQDGGSVTLTGASSGQRSSGQTPAEPAVVVTATAGSVTMARQEIQTQGSDFVFFGNVEQLVIGSGLAEQGLEWLLWYVADDPELRLESKIWVVDGKASDVLSGVEVTNRLKAILDDGETSGSPVGRTAREVLVELADYGASIVPSLEVDPEGMIRSQGYALIQSNGLAGWVDGVGVKGATLLLGGGEGGALMVDGQSVTLEQITIKVGAVQNPLSVTVDCNLEVNLAEGRNNQQVDLGRLGDEISQLFELELDACQFESDFLHLVERATMSAPWLGQPIKGIPFRELDINVSVETRVQHY